MREDTQSPDFEARMVELAQQFAGQLPGWLAEVQALGAEIGPGCWSPEAAERLRQRAHQLAGAAPPLGFSRLGEAARRVEVSVREASATSADAQRRGRLDLALQDLQRALGERPHPDAARAHPIAVDDPLLLAARAGRLIYLVDDDPIQAQELAAQVEHFGYAVRVLTHLDQAEAAVRLQPPTAIYTCRSAPAWNSRP